MEQTMELRGRLGFLEDQVKLAIIAFQQDEASLLLGALAAAKGAIEDISKTVNKMAA